MNLTTFRHGETIEELKEKFNEARKTMYLNEIDLRYKKWKAANLEISDNEEENLKEKIRLYAEYREFLFSKKYRKFKTFLKERKLFETALSEFVYYLLKDLDVFSDDFVFKRARIPIDFNFNFVDFNKIGKNNFLDVKKQKMRCVIGKNVDLNYNLSDSKNNFNDNFTFPLMVTETAMIMDNWLANNINQHVRRIKKYFPNCYAAVVCEVISDDFDFDISDSKLDYIYIIQRQTAAMKRRDISFNVINSYLNSIREKFVDHEEKFNKIIDSGIIKG